MSPAISGKRKRTEAAELKPFVCAADKQTHHRGVYQENIHRLTCRVFCVSLRLTASETRSLHVRHQPIYNELSTQLNTLQASPTDSFTLLSTQKHNATRRRPQNGKGKFRIFSIALLTRVDSRPAALYNLGTGS